MNLSVKITFVVTLLAIYSGTLQAADRYVATNGADSGSGTIGSPWLTIQYAENNMAGGETCYVRAGTYRERVNINNANITIKAYNNETVKVSACDEVSGWSVDSGNIYKADCNWSRGSLNALFADNEFMTLARWPNTSASDRYFDVGLAQMDSGNSTTITDTDLGGKADNYWRNGYVQVRGEWCYQGESISSSSGNNVNFDSIDSDGDNGPSAGEDYAIVNVFGELDAAYEWYLDEGANKLYFWHPNGDDPDNYTVELTSRDATFVITANGITIEGIHALGAPITITADGVTIKDCLVEHMTHQADIQPIYENTDSGIVIEGDGNTVRDCEIAYSSGNLIICNGESNAFINNYIHDGNYNGTYDANIAMFGSFNHLAYNTIENTGRDGLQWRGARVLVEYNDFSHFGKKTTDCGANYSVMEDGGNSEIRYNLMHDNEAGYGMGMYLDNGDSNFQVHHNTIWNTGQAGIMLNCPSHFNVVYSNMCDGGFSGGGMENWWGHVWNNETYGNRFEGNISTKSWNIGGDAKVVGNTTVGFTTNGYAPAGHDFGSPPNPTYLITIHPYANKIENSSFDQVLTGWSQSGTVSQEEIDWGNYSESMDAMWSTTANQHSSYASCKLGSDGANISKTITGLKPSTDYEASAWIKAGNSTTVELKVSGYGGGDLTASATGTSPNWAHKTISFTTGSSDNSATITITRSGANACYIDDVGLILNEVAPVAAPVASNDAYIAFYEDTLSISAPGVLGNDQDWGAPSLTAVLVSDVSNGSLSLSTNGSFTYTPTNGYTGSDSFTYKANNGTDDSNIATGTFTIVQATGTGTILRELWTGISGGNVSDLTGSADYPDNPSSTGLVTALEGLATGNEYGSRIHGYLHPPVSGDYTFWISGDDSAELWLSTDATTGNVVKICETTSYTDWKEWDKFPGQQSAPISVVTGQTYYIMALHKEDGGGDHVSVAWEGPGFTQALLDGAYLSPFNYGPTANDDSYSTSKDIQLGVSAPGILDNDTGSSLSAVLGTDVGSGVLNLSSNGSFTYDDAGVTGVVTFTYYAIDGGSGITSDSPATVTINVNPPLPPSPPGYRMQITFPGYDKSETLTNFPVLVVLNELITGFLYSNFESPANGYDLRFRNAAQDQELNYEIESWDTNGNSYVWVQVKSLANGDYIFAYWGDPANASQPTYSTNGSTWSQDYVGVYHMNETPGDGVTYSDSTTVNDGTMTDGSGVDSYSVSGAAAGGVHFTDGPDDYISLANEGNFDIASNITVSVWTTNYPSDWHPWVAKGESSSWQLRAASANQPAFCIRGTAGANTEGYGVAVAFTPGWHMVAGTYSGTDYTIYLDGDQNNTGANTGSISENNNPVRIGARAQSSDAGDFIGDIDEVRISSVVRSSNWVWAVYENIANNDTFCLYGEATFSGSMDSNLVAYIDIHYPGTSNYNAVAAGDTDFDGFTVEEEFVADTVPTNPDSFFKIVDLNDDPSGYIIKWRSSTNRWYKVYKSTNLTEGWIEPPLISNYWGITSGTNSYTNVDLTNPKVFYIIKVEKP